MEVTTLVWFRWVRFRASSLPPATLHHPRESASLRLHRCHGVVDAGAVGALQRCVSVPSVLFYRLSSLANAPALCSIRRPFPVRNALVGTHRNRVAMDEPLVGICCSQR